MGEKVADLKKEIKTLQKKVEFQEESIYGKKVALEWKRDWLKESLKDETDPKKVEEIENELSVVEGEILADTGIIAKIKDSIETAFETVVGEKQSNGTSEAGEV